MKNTPQIQNLSSGTNRIRALRATARGFPQIGHNYQSSQLVGSCGTPVKFDHPAFFEISNEYFAEEAARGFAVDAAVFAALIATALLPIVNGVQAVATLIHTLGVL